MKNIWDQFSDLSRYYLIGFCNFLICWPVLYLFKIEFINCLFFTTSFVWHFALLTPGIREKVMNKKQRLSFINVIVRSNYYLQLFIRIKNFKYSSSFVRAISPLVFTLLLVVAGGSGNLLFTLLGSVAFELVYLLLSKKITSTPLDDAEIPGAIPSVENSHE